MLQSEYLNRLYCQMIAEDKAAHAESAQREIRYINGSTAKYHGRCVSTLYIPKFFTREDILIFEGLIQTLYGLQGLIFFTTKNQKSLSSANLIRMAQAP